MTGTDTQFVNRFPDMDVSTFVANQSDLANYVPSSSVINNGLLSDIGRATCYAPDLFANNFYGRFIRAPLGRGDSAMTVRAGEVISRAYDPMAADTALFNGQYASVSTNVAKKNFSRQIATEINDRLLKQYCQTEEMVGDLAASIMAASNVCMADDMWVASKTYYSGDMRSAQNDQVHVMTAAVGDANFAAEMNELIWTITQKQFGYKSEMYNASRFNTMSSNVNIALTKECEYPAFKKLYADTFHPDAIRVLNTIDYVDDFATPASKPENAGDLIGMIVDNRAFSITPMPEAVSTEAFRNPARKSTAYFTTYEYAFQHDPFFNCAYIFAPSE